ncbi:hypothetical protein Pint_33396 [Pistacia integerrima]|uniref:Uncharacterized protein n=1 Tax=Pistacia integerrima TaxID=434235 RepID=A0ACC0X7X0_9ROSI|nr:hypothetical protein Pint_33396 [Pistacia integerrima]
MSIRGSWQSFLQLLHRYRYTSTYNSPWHLPAGRVTVANLGHGFSMHQTQGLHLISNGNSGAWRKLDANMLKDDIDKVKPAPATPPPPRFNFALWAKWILGSILSLLLPFWKQKWEKLQKIEGGAEMVVEGIENVAEVVEKVADKVSTQMADKLHDNTKLQEAALLVERVSKATAQDAELTINFIHKVNALKEDLDDLETMVEPIVDKIVKHESEGK